MGNKETKRTITNMLNYCIVIIFILLQLSFAFATEIKTEPENALNNTIAETNSTTSAQPQAEPLVRFRRQPPRTIVKHIIRPKRMKIKRAKRPKIRYSFAEPPQNYYRRKPTYSSHSKAPTFDTTIFEDFSHYNVESTDFDLPPSSYEAQSMDLDLYKNYEAPAEASYKEIQKAPPYEYNGPEVSYKEIQKLPTYEYAAPESSYKGPEVSYKEPEVSYEAPKVSYEAPEVSYKQPEISYKTPEVTYKGPTKTYTYIPSSHTTETRKPHTKYGVPTEFVYSTGYDKPTGNKYSYEEPSFKPSKPVYTEIKRPSYTPPNKEEYSHSAPSKNEEYSYSPPKETAPRIPATKYGVPDLHLPSPGINDYNKYSIASYTPTKSDNYNFAEPPQPETNVEITYSPSYEINIPSSKETQYGGGKYGSEHQPPRQNYEQPSQQYHPEQPSYGQSPKYEDSPQQYDTPEYHPPSHPQQNYDQHPGYQEGSDTNQPPTYHPAPPSPPHHASIEEYIPHTQDLPINVNHQQRPYNYPKSSYEVPIYDAIPFDASNNQQHEIYPPQFTDHSSRQHNSDTEYLAEPNNVSEQRPQPPESEETSPGDAHSSGTRPLPQSTTTTSKKPISPINHVRKTRKRKRQRGSSSSSSTSTTKHILDVPELQEAFEKDNRNRLQQEKDIDAHESQKVENINYYNGPWNPMKIRTSPLAVTTPSSTSAITSSSTSKRRYLYKQRSTRTTSSTTTTSTTTEPPLPENNSIPKVEIISIEKSRSKTYYDGILSTPRVYNANIFRNRFKFEKSTTASPAAAQSRGTNENKFSKRTTKNVFDTTVFKSPVNDRNRDIYRNLPKNHKLF